MKNIYDSATFKEFWYVDDAKHELNIAESEVTIAKIIKQHVNLPKKNILKTLYVHSINLQLQSAKRNISAVPQKKSTSETFGTYSTNRHKKNHSNLQTLFIKISNIKSGDFEYQYGENNLINFKYKPINRVILKNTKLEVDKYKSKQRITLESDLAPVEFNLKNTDNKTAEHLLLQSGLVNNVTPKLYKKFNKLYNYFNDKKFLTTLDKQIIKHLDVIGKNLSNDSLNSRSTNEVWNKRELKEYEDSTNFLRNLVTENKTKDARISNELIPLLCGILGAITGFVVAAGITILSVGTLALATPVITYAVASGVTAASLGFFATKRSINNLNDKHALVEDLNEEKLDAVRAKY